MAPEPSANPSPTQEVKIRSACWNSDGELTALVVETPEETVELLPEIVVIGLRERLQAEVEKRKEAVADRNGWKGEALELRAGADRARAAESKLSSAVEAVEGQLEGEEDLYTDCIRTADIDGQVIHGTARYMLRHVRKLLRDKGTEQGGDGP